MPIYEYKCPSCGVVEVFQGINDAPLCRCPKCRRHKVRKLISESSFQLKGSGWYVTDYGRGNGKGKKAQEKAREKAEPEKTVPKAKTKDRGPKSSEASTATS